MADSKRLVRLAAGTMLLAQASTKKKLAKTVAVHVDAVAAEAARRHERDKKAAALALLLLGAKAMVPDLARSIVDGRADARKSARGRLFAELKAAGLALGAAPWVFGNRAEEDAAHAQLSAESLASQWQGLAAASLIAARRVEQPVAQAIRGTVRKMKDRTERTAATETAQAYSDEHREALRDLVRQDRQLAGGEWAAEAEAKLARQWSALLDACERCWPHDGETVGLNETFSGGDEPGFMHARCRCIEVIVEADAMSVAA